MNTELMTPIRPSCLAVHALLQFAHGPAADFACSAECGRPAREWAYLYNSQHELRDSKGQRYAGMDALDCYVPLCRGCHSRWDISNGSKQGVYSRTDEIRAKMSDAAKQRWALNPDGHRAMSLKGSTSRFRCDGCGLETTAGPLGGHQRSSGHTGRSRVSPSIKTAVPAERSVF